jgi:isoprenylcysteine carboxyl methyltransferase (ICMT) family protein YpbQ
MNIVEITDVWNMNFDDTSWKNNLNRTKHYKAISFFHFIFHLFDTFMIIFAVQNYDWPSFLKLKIVLQQIHINKMNAFCFKTKDVFWNTKFCLHMSGNKTSKKSDFNTEKSFNNKNIIQKT